MHYLALSLSFCQPPFSLCLPLLSFSPFLPLASLSSLFLLVCLIIFLAFFSACSISVLSWGLPSSFLISISFYSILIVFYFSDRSSYVFSRPFRSFELMCFIFSHFFPFLSPSSSVRPCLFHLTIPFLFFSLPHLLFLSPSIHLVRFSFPVILLSLPQF